MMIENEKPIFSVITVCFNAMTVLPLTAASLRSQATTSGIEWIVIDGGSTDGSVDWLATQQPDVFVSEPDSGIYDAMNKAVARARGDWLFFLNAGDAFADEHVLADVARAVEGSPAAELVFGDVVYFGDSGERRHRFHWLTRRRLLFGDLCHQAVFAHRSLFLRHGTYDLSLRWNADFDWFLRTFRGGAVLKYISRDIARFHDAGAHVQQPERTLAERNVVRRRVMPLALWQLGNWALRVELKIRRLVGQEI
jgi:glycosyltransferase involved in cell wall biosynthesis